MQPSLSAFWRRAVFALVVIGGAVAGEVRAQDQAAMKSDEGPRFLVALGERGKRVETVPSKVPLLAARVTLSVDDVPLTEVLARFGRQADVAFVYGPDVVQANRRVSVHAKQITLAAALTEVLFGAGVDVLLSGRGQLTLVLRADAAKDHGGSLVGRVLDAKTREGLSGAEVLLEKTPWRTMSDSSGRYQLVAVEAGTYTLIVRRLGYAKQSRQVVISDRQDTVDVALEPAAVALDELVTTATGQQRRRDIGNAITTIKADSVLRTAPIRSLTDLLANRVPGMSLQHTSGAPGDPARLRLRGISSVMRGNDPVVIVDGIRIYAAQSEARSGNLTNLGLEAVTLRPDAGAPAPSPLDQIDPNIIEKIEVFKGPSAATLYGADAANGVIVITTKRGKPGPTRWNASAQFGRTTPASAYPAGYYRWAHVPQNGLQVLCPLVDRYCVVDSLVRYQALNDPDMTILGRGHRSALSLNASGGSQALTYSVTGTYADETGLLQLPEFEAERFRTQFNREAPNWMRRPHHLKNWSVTSNVRALLGPAAEVTLSTSLTRSDQQRTELEDQQAALARLYVDKIHGAYLEPRTFTQGTSLYLLYQDLSPVKSYYARRTASAITFTTGLSANWRPRTWFNATGQAGLNVIPRDDEYLLPTGIPHPTDSGALIRGTGRSLVSTFNVQGTARKPLKWGFAFETSVGANLITQGTNDLVSSATGLVPGTSSLSGATRFTATDARVNTSVFGWYLEPRLTGQRLSLSTGLRLDGGSAYGTRLTRTGGGLFGGLLGLPKLNGSWVISEEPWFPFTALFSSLRLRGGYGQAQVQPGATDRLRLYQRSIAGTGDLLQLSTLGNTALRPERSTEFEGGFDADLLGNRLSLELTAYRKLQVDALMPVQLPSSVHGGGTIVQNIGNIRNTGLEVVTRLTPVRSALATWSAQLLYSHNTNVLTKLGSGVVPNPQQGFVAGYPVAGRWSRPILGYADRNGDGAIDLGEVQIGDSLVFLGRLHPAYQMALSTDLALFNGAVGVSASFSYDGGATQVDQTLRDNWILSRALFDPTAPLAQQAAAVSYDSTTYGLTQDLSTFRFRTLSVNYHAPARVARLVHAQQLAIALQGSNLGLHSRYGGKDPDVSAWSPGEQMVDTGQLAQPRTWQLRVDLGF